MEKNFNVSKGAEPNIIEKLYSSKSFNRLMDAIRIAMLIGVVLIIVILLININEVKILNSDVCALCEKFNGVTCWYPKLS